MCSSSARSAGLMGSFVVTGLATVGAGRWGWPLTLLAARPCLGPSGVAALGPGVAGCRAQESWDWCQFNGGQVSPQHWQTRGRTQRLHDGACQSQSPCGRASPPKWLCQHPCSQGGPCCLLPLSEPSEISKGLWPESFQIIASVLGLRFWVYSIRAESLLVFVYLFCLFFNIYSFGHPRS